MSRTRITRILCTCLLAAILAGCGAKDAAQNMTRSDDGATLPLPATGTDITIDLSENAFSFVDDAGAQEKKDNTVLLYMVGSNLESEAQAASRDLLEIATSGVNAGKTNVVICTGGTRGWWFDIPSDRNTIIRLDARKGLTFDAETEKLQNMGTAQTLVDFLNFSATAYPADHYSLIFWDHGSGPIQGFCYDEVFKDILELTELQAALDASVFGDGVRLDYIGFDACLMASIEMAGILSDYTDYLIASQETESGAGWDYSFLNTYNKTSDTDAVAEAILTSYDRYFKENRTLFFNPDVTLSCMDLTKVAGTEQAMDALFRAMAKDLDTGAYRMLLEYRNQMKSFGLAATGGRGNSLDLVDLGDLAEVMSAEYRTEAAALKTAVDELVVSQVTNVRNASGVSVYYPYNNTDLFDYYGLALYGAMNGSAGYLDYMRAYADKWSSGEEPQDLTAIYADMDTGTVTEEEITLQLTKEQIENAEAITYTVLQETGEGLYTPLVRGVTCTPDENGLIHIPHDQRLFAVVTDKGERDICPTAQISEEEDRTVFQALAAQLNNSLAFRIWGDAQTYHITYSRNKKDGNVTLKTVEASGETNYQGGVVSHSGKGDVDVGSWDYITLMSFDYIAEQDENGRMKAFYEWQSNHSVWTSYLKLDRTFHMEEATLSETPNRKVVQIIVRDSQGGRHASDLLELKVEGLPETVTQKVRNGTMEFDVYADHAELNYYEGTDTGIQIPDKVNGVPVTVLGERAFYRLENVEQIMIPDTVEKIGMSAFYECRSLREISLPSALREIGPMAFFHADAIEEVLLPDKLEQIGTYAFAHTAIEELVIPAGVKTIEEGALTSMEKLMDVRLEKEDYYSVKDHVLFADHGRMLHTYPQGLPDSYTIPEGVEVICDYAFEGNREMKRVDYPESLREIGDFAFYECGRLEDALSFPLNLERIGAGAFFALFSGEEDEPETEVVIGPHVREIGTDAFDGRNIVSITVVKDNEIYASVNGALTNKAGDYLIKVANATEGEYTIPDGIVTVGADAFDTCYNITELVVPDSVIVMEGLSQPGDKITIGSGLMDWEGAYTSNYTEVVISADNEYFSAEGGIIFNHDKTELIRYPSTVADEEYHVPDTVERIGDYAFSNRSLRKLYLPASLKDGVTNSYYGDNNFAIGLGGLEEIVVADENEWYCSLGGAVYSKDQKTLHIVPANNEAFTLAETVETITPKAMYEIRTSREVRIPDGITDLSSFMDTISVPYGVEDMTVDLYLPESIEAIDETFLNTEVRAIARGEKSVLTVHCKKGSYADSFFRERNLQVKYD